MEKHLQATQKFLKGLVSLPTFADVKARQLKHLSGVIEKAASQSTGAVADLVASLDPTIWNQEELESLKHALAQKVSEGKERRKMPRLHCISALSPRAHLECVVDQQQPKGSVGVFGQVLHFLGNAMPK